MTRKMSRKKNEKMCWYHKEGGILQRAREQRGVRLAKILTKYHLIEQRNTLFIILCWIVNKCWPEDQCHYWGGRVGPNPHSIRESLNSSIMALLTNLAAALNMLSWGCSAWEEHSPWIFSNFRSSNKKWQTRIDEMLGLGLIIALVNGIKWHIRHFQTSINPSNDRLHESFESFLKLPNYFNPHLKSRKYWFSWGTELKGIFYIICDGLFQVPCEYDPA